MLEFFKFLWSLVLVLFKYIHKTHIVRIRHFYTLLSQRIIKNQSAYIIWPVCIAFVLSYPALYSLLVAPESLDCSYLTDHYSTDILGSDVVSSNVPELILKQVWLMPTQTVKEDYFDVTPGALEKNFLADALKFQELLFENIPTSTEDVFVRSPLEFWDNDINNLKNDKSPLRTINTRTSQSSRKQGLSYNGLLSGAVKVNDVVKSAEAIRIMMVYVNNTGTSDFCAIWDHNLAALENATDVNFAVAKENKGPTSRHFISKLTRMNAFDRLLLGASYIVMALYFFFALSNMSSVTSKAGLLLAFVVEMTLSILSAATLTTYFFQGVDFFEIPLQFLPFVVVVVGMENMLRLVTAVSKAPGEMSVSHRISRTLEQCGVTSTFVVLVDLLILALIYPYLSPNSQVFCLSASFALIIDHILHLTFFVSVLSVDVHRMELEDLLDTNIDQTPRSWANYFYGDDATTSLDGATKKASVHTYMKQAVIVMDKISSILTTTTFTGSVVAFLFLIGTNIRWMGFSRLSSETLTSSDASNMLDKRLLNGYISFLLDAAVFKSSSRVLLTVDSPVYAFQGRSLGATPSTFSLNTIYRFDIYYILEFLTLLTFILSLSLIAFKYFTANLTTEDEDRPLKKVLEKEHSFQSKVLSGGHFLDIIKITTSKSHFIVSVGLDHKVLVWSPISQPMPLPTHLPIGAGLWPITNVVLSDHGNFIALFSKSGVLQCWSRRSMSWVWRLCLPELQNTVALESFFRHKTVPAFLQRKKANELLKAAAANTRVGSRRNSMRSIASPQLSATVAFSNNSDVGDELEEFVIVLRTGEIVTISCQDGDLKREKLSSAPLVSCAKLITPRVNDRLVSCDETGVILVSTAVNNKWKTRSIVVDSERFNNPPKMGSHSMRRVPSKLQNEIVAEEPPSPKLSHPIDFDKSAIALVPFVGFIVRTYEDLAELIDVQTGILIKRFKIRHFKKGSFRIFHDQPTHCRFCGSASVASLSVVYTLAEMKTVVMHTFTVDHKVKTSICLRVERDPREIRCVGFNQVSEHQYELSNVDGWCVTDKNQIMGIKRKSEEQIQESIAKSDTLRRRTLSSQRHFTDESAPKLYNLWEGWTMSAHGKMDTYDIPDVGNANGLLVNSVGQIARFGHKSIVVSIGNIMKVLYLGNDDLVYNDDDQPANEDISGLNFVNKRRKNLKKHDQKSSPSLNFGEVNGIPGISELSL